MTEEIYQEEFKQLVLQSENPVVADFFATWCGPCKMLSSVLEKLSDEYPLVDFYKINVDENRELAEKFGIKSIPRVLVFKNGEQLDSSLGYKSLEEMREFLEACLK